jgi:hypothetical protein
MFRFTFFKKNKKKDQEYDQQYQEYINQMFITIDKRLKNQQYQQYQTQESSKQIRYTDPFTPRTIL